MFPNIYTYINDCYFQQSLRTSIWLWLVRLVMINMCEYLDQFLIELLEEVLKFPWIFVTELSLFVVRNFRGKCFCVEMLKRHTVKERLETPVLESRKRRKSRVKSSSLCFNVLEGSFVFFLRMQSRDVPACAAPFWVKFSLWEPTRTPRFLPTFFHAEVLAHIVLTELTYSRNNFTGKFGGPWISVSRHGLRITALEFAIMASNPSIEAVVPKLVRAVTWIKVAIMSYYLKYFASWKERNQYTCIHFVFFVQRYPPKESHITPNLGTTALKSWSWIFRLNHGPNYTGYDLMLVQLSICECGQTSSGRQSRCFHRQKARLWHFNNRSRLSVLTGGWDGRMWKLVWYKAYCVIWWVAVWESDA